MKYTALRLLTNNITPRYRDSKQMLINCQQSERLPNAELFVLAEPEAHQYTIEHHLSCYITLSSEPCKIQLSVRICEDNKMNIRV